MSADPTYVPVVSDDRTNPFVKRMYGWTNHGNHRIDVPFISEITPGFYQGGCEDGLVLPESIEYVVSLYHWEKYTLPKTCKARFEFEMYDSIRSGPGTDEILELANLVNDLRKKGTTLVHCQAGLNRSGLIAGAAMMLDGWTAEDTINTLRGKRSPAVLCNPTFESWLREFQP